MFITYKKGIKLDGSNPTILYGYGGFNIALTPSFSATRIPFLDQGGVFAQANLRGGSEYGEKWHEQGMKLKKQNVFDDFIAAAEYLIKEKYTSSARLALQGGSNGGLYRVYRDPEVENRELYGEGQWAVLKKLIAERNPKNIAVNISPTHAFSDGLSAGEWERLQQAKRVCPKCCRDTSR
jgi:hypothetical protein